MENWILQKLVKSMHATAVPGKSHTSMTSTANVTAAMLAESLHSILYSKCARQHSKAGDS